MKAEVESIQLLQSILKVENPDRENIVKKFQNKVWNDKNIQDKYISDILSELAYDLDFYEPNLQLQEESPNFFGDDKLEILVKEGIKKLQIVE